MKKQLYGEWIASPDDPIQDQDGGRILGCLFEPDATGGQNHSVKLQYGTSPGNPVQVRFRLPETIALLSFLKAMQLDLGLPFPDDPRGP